MGDVMRPAAMLATALLALTVLAGCGRAPPAAVSDAPPDAPAAQVQGPRVALIVANAAYANASRLRNPESDAELVAQTLRDAGFEVSLARNVSKSAFTRSLQDFRDRADVSSVAMIYYAGHGMEIGGRNWLIPVDAQLKDERDLPVEAVDLDTTVLSTLEAAKGLRIVVLDACRDNPFARSMRRVNLTRAIGRGLAEVEVSDTLVVYAARAGSTASDGEGDYSPFAEALARRLPEPGVDVQILFRRVRDDVLRATDNKQEPYQYGSLRGDSLYLVPPIAGANVPLVVAAAAGIGGCWLIPGADASTAMTLSDKGDTLDVSVAGASVREQIVGREPDGTVHTNGAAGPSSYAPGAGGLVLLLGDGSSTRFIPCGS